MVDRRPSPPPGRAPLVVADDEPFWPVRAGCAVAVVRQHHAQHGLPPGWWRIRDSKTRRDICRVHPDAAIRGPDRVLASVVRNLTAPHLAGRLDRHGLGVGRRDGPWVVAEIGAAPRGGRTIGLRVEAASDTSWYSAHVRLGDDAEGVPDVISALANNAISATGAVCPKSCPSCDTTQATTDGLVVLTTHFT